MCPIPLPTRSVGVVSRVPGQGATTLRAFPCEHNNPKETTVIKSHGYAAKHSFSSLKLFDF